MVIGNGLIASKFSKYVDNDKVIIFASGVSNSKENDSKKFEREISLLSSLIGTEKKIIYFSTLLINYPCSKNTNYVKHKNQVEKLISKNFDNFIIFRLPNIVGLSNNRFTSFNFFINKILSGESIEIESKTSRFFLDSDDLEPMLTKIIDNELINKKTINVCLNNKIFIKDLIDLLFMKLNKKVDVIEHDFGCDITIDNRFFLDIIERDNLTNLINYNDNLISKYCSNGNL